MFYSSGYFKHIDCPFLMSGLCERPYCHFRHSNSKTNKSFPNTISDYDNHFYGDGYLPINDKEYNPVDFVTEVKPSYSPAINSAVVPVVNSTKSSGVQFDQSIQTEAFQPTCSNDLVTVSMDVTVKQKNDNVLPTIVQSKRVIEPNVDQVPEKISLICESEVKPTLRKSGKRKITGKEKLNNERSSLSQTTTKMTEAKKIKQVKDILRSIFDSDDSLDNEGGEIDYDGGERMSKARKSAKTAEKQSHKNVMNKNSKVNDHSHGNRHHQKVQSVIIDQRPVKDCKIQIEEPKPSSMKVDNESEKYFKDLETALITGRYNGRRLTTVDILRFRMELADRGKDENPVKK